MDNENIFPKAEGKKWKKGVFWSVLGLVLLFFGGFFFGSRAEASNKYLKKGDEFLKQKRYLSAIVEYKKAEFLYSTDEVNGRIETARKSERDVRNLEEFYVETGDEADLAELTEAKAVPETAFSAVKQAKEFLESGKPQLAELLSETATEMDSGYKDAWLYLGIARVYSASNLEISVEVKEDIANKAVVALETAGDIDPEDETVGQFLSQAKKLTGGSTTQ